MQGHAALLSLLAALATLAGCSSLGSGGSGDAVVVRTSNSTTWATDESMAAAAAAEAARARAVRAATPTPPPRPAPPLPQALPEAAVVVAGSAVGMALPPRQADTERIVYFDFDRYELREEFKLMLERRARAMLGAPQQGLVVEGHADERGGREYNLALGQKRAEAVVRMLALFGAPAARLEAVSFGDTRPAAAGHDETAWSQNRRAELKDR